MRHINSLAFAIKDATRICVLDSERVALQTESLNSLNLTSFNGQKDLELILSLALENTVQRNPDAAFGNVIM